MNVTLPDKGDSKLPAYGKGEPQNWENIAPTPITTFPKYYFIGYIICLLLVLPLTLIKCIVNGIYALVIYGINKLFYMKAKSLLVPIKPSHSSFVIITGSASGIGKDMALLYAIKGFSLILIDIDDNVQSYSEKLQKQFANQTFRYLIIDLSLSTSSDIIYNTIINEWKILNVKILVNNAGFGDIGEFLNQNINKLNTMIRVNCITCMELAHKFGKYFVLNGSGRICQIASVGAYTPGSHAAVYHATKSFIRHWAIAFQHELIGTGVGLTIVCPAPVRTGFAKKSNSTKSVIFNELSWLTYDSMSVAKAAVNGTLKGSREIVHGPLWHATQNFLSLVGETFNIIITKFVLSDPSTKTRSSYVTFQPLKKYK